VIEAQQDLVDARDARDRALADLRTAVLQFLLATGQMRVSGEGRWLQPVKLVPVPDPLLEQAEHEDLDMIELQQSLPEALQGAARMNSTPGAQRSGADAAKTAEPAEESADRSQAEESGKISPSERRAQRRAQRERENQAAEQADSGGE
jgi:hypothetical protein